MALQTLEKPTLQILKINDENTTYNDCFKSKFPAIISYRRELGLDSRKSTQRTHNQWSRKSFLQSISNKEEHQLSVPGGFHTLISQSTQTEWTWMDEFTHEQDMQAYGHRRRKSSCYHARVRKDKTDGNLFKENRLPVIFQSQSNENIDLQKNSESNSDIDLHNIAPDSAEYTEKEKLRNSSVETEQLEEYLFKFGHFDGGIFTGLCEFCLQEIKTLSTIEEQPGQSIPTELFCCEDYKVFLVYSLNNPLEITPTVDLLFDIKPQPSSGNTHARRKAKERALQRMRDRELARQIAAVTQRSGLIHGSANFYPFLKPMTTINYQLSASESVKGIWNLESSMEQNGEFRAKVLENLRAKSGKKNEVENNQKRTVNKVRFNRFPDGTGNIYQPNGSIAISIMQFSPKTHCYTIHGSDTDGRSYIAAVLHSNGSGAVYYPSNSIRLTLTQSMCVEFAESGTLKRKWNWNNSEDHIHAPPIQPITAFITPFVSIRIVNRHKILIMFSHETNTFRLRIGAEKPVTNAKKDLNKNYEMRHDYVCRKKIETRIDWIFKKVASIIKAKRDIKSKCVYDSTKSLRGNTVKKRSKTKTLSF